MSETIPAPPQNPIPPTPPIKPIPPQKIKEQITEGDKDKTAPKQYEYLHTFSHWGILAKCFAGVASKSDIRNVSPIYKIIAFIILAIYVMLTMSEDFLTPAMRSSICIFVLPFLIVLIPKSLPLLVRRVHAFGKSGLWVFGIIPFLIILVTYFLPLLVVGGASSAIDGSEGNMAAVAAGSVITGIAIYVIGSIIGLIYFLYWLIKIHFSDAPVDIDERERKKSNILCGKTGLQIDKIRLSYKAARQTPSDNSERLFKTTAGKWIFAASVVLCSIPLIYQFTPRQIVVQELWAHDIKPKKYESKLLENCALENSKTENIEIVKLLLKAGTDINTQKYGYTPLQKASSKGNTEIVKILLEAGADVNKADGNGSTPLHDAAFYGRTEEVKLLIEAGADVNKANMDDITPLQLAAVEGQTEVVKLLIEAGADVNKADKNKISPLYTAVYNGHTEIVKMLITAGADVFDSHLNAAKKEGNEEIVKLLVTEIENNVRFVNTVSEGNTEAVKLLIEAGADVNKAANRGRTPLYTAVHDGLIEVAKVLIEAGADVNKATKYGSTPLKAASEEYHTEIVELLKAAGLRSK